MAREKKTALPAQPGTLPGEGCGFPCLRAVENGVRLFVQAVPRSSFTEMVDLAGDRCRIKVKALPVEGEANLALTDFLARFFGVPKKQVVLEKGTSGKQKQFLLVGVSMAVAVATLTAHEGKAATVRKK